MLNKLIDKKVVVSFESLEEQNKFLKWCGSKGVVDAFGEIAQEKDVFYKNESCGLISKGGVVDGYKIINYSELFEGRLSLPQVVEQIKEGEIYEQIQEQIFDAESKPMEITKNELGEIILLFNCNSKDFQGLYLNELLFKLKVQHKNFHEVVDINKRCLTNCRVEHWLIDTNMKCISEDMTMIDLWDRFCKGEYLPLGIVLQVLGWMCTDSMAEIIKDGKWYLEGGN